MQKNMPVVCIVIGCSSRYQRDKVRFYSIPAALNNKFLTHKNELSAKRRNRWLTAINRGGLTDSIIRNQRVCSKHFVTGKPAALEDENHPDWVPTQNMGNMDYADVIKHSKNAERKKRADQRRDLHHSKLLVENNEDLDAEIASGETRADIYVQTNDLNLMKPETLDKTQNGMNPDIGNQLEK
ncbi:hypothetical protein HUJ05_004445 [Dendroctonus ponderosae]|nr:hypothetical protein HUJ05_004445 [Dendroctonus ponderosae]